MLKRVSRMPGTAKITRAFLLFLGTVFALPCLFFGYYTVRLIYVNLFSEGAAEHRSGGMLIGAIVFPLAALLFGVVSWFCFKRALTGGKLN
jgi:hypothetical protein